MTVFAKQASKKKKKGAAHRLHFARCAPPGSAANRLELDRAAYVAKSAADKSVEWLVKDSNHGVQRQAGSGGVAPKCG